MNTITAMVGGLLEGAFKDHVGALQLKKRHSFQRQINVAYCLNAWS